MLTRQVLLLAASSLLLAGAVTALAKDPPPLTPEKIRSLLATLPEVSALGEKYDAVDDPLPQIAGGDEQDPQAALERMRSGMLSGAVGSLKEHSAWAEFQSITRANGFASVEEWANVGDRVMGGFLQLQLDQEAPELRTQMMQAREELLANDEIPEDYKKMMLEQFEQQMGMFEALKTSEVVQPGDLAQIAPMLDEIRAVLQPE